MNEVWSRDFDNSERHCWFNTQDRRFEEHEFPHNECTRWRDHPYRRGNTAWLRFIRAFGSQIEEGNNPFVSGDLEDGQRPKFSLFMESDGHDTSDGRHAFCETYLRLHEKDWGLNPVFRVFVANNSGWARIELYEAEFIEAAEAALACVEQSYVDEEENIGVAA